MTRQTHRRVEAKRVIEKMKDDDQKCSTPSQTIQHLKMLFSATRPNEGVLLRSPLEGRVFLLII